MRCHHTTLMALRPVGEVCTSTQAFKPPRASKGTCDGGDGEEGTEEDAGITRAAFWERLDAVMALPTAIMIVWSLGRQASIWLGC